MPDEFQEVKLPSIDYEEYEDHEEYMPQRHKPDVTEAGIEDEIREESSEEASDAEIEIEGDTSSYCSVCHREVKNEHQSLLCDRCTTWSHRNCVGMKKKKYRELMKNENFNWNCPACPEPEDAEPQIEEPPDDLE